MPGTQKGFSYCNHRAKQKKNREEVATGDCVPVAGRSEISCALLWVNKESTTDGCGTESSERNPKWDCASERALCASEQQIREDGS